MQQFSFFDPTTVGERLRFGDLGDALRVLPPERAGQAVMKMVEDHGADLLVIDSFRAIRDLNAGGGNDRARGDTFRLFVHDLVSRLAGARVTTLLLGEYDRSDLSSLAEFAVADGIVFLGTTDQYGEHQRSLQVLKMRGQAADLRPFPFLITGDGVKLLASSATVAEPHRPPAPHRVPTGVAGLDALLDGGIPGGRASLLSGRSGTGKTTLGVQFLRQGCEAGEKSLLVTFEQAPDRLRELAAGFGWDLTAHEAEGRLKILHIPQSGVRVMPNLDLISRVVKEFAPDRVLLDSLSAYLHRVPDSGLQRDLTYRLVSLVQEAGAVGLLVSDVPAEGEERQSKFGVEETVADGVVLLSTASGEYGQRRYLEVPKMRACPHETGRRRMTIGPAGVEVFYSSAKPSEPVPCPEKIAFGPMAPALESGLPYGTTWLVRGPGGAGKTTLLQQFVADGLAVGDTVLYLTLDSPQDRVRRQMALLGIDVAEPEASGQLKLLLAGAPTAGRPRHADRLDLTDPESLLFQLDRAVEEMRNPIRVVIDSLWPLAARLSPEAFASLVSQKNQILRRPHVTLMDTLSAKALDERIGIRVETAYDTVLYLARNAVGAGPADAADRRIRLTINKIRGAAVKRGHVDLTAIPGRGLIADDFDALAAPAREPNEPA